MSLRPKKASKQLTLVERLYCEPMPVNLEGNGCFFIEYAAVNAFHLSVDGAQKDRVEGVAMILSGSYVWIVRNTEIELDLKDEFKLTFLTGERLFEPNPTNSICRWFIATFISERREFIRIDIEVVEIPHTIS